MSMNTSTYVAKGPGRALITWFLARYGTHLMCDNKTII